jgi:8-oxo-dGTP pyrophosphatase MutT (NUDIX family)
MKQKLYRAAGGVVVHDGKMLLLDRPARGEVRLPKGHIDPGEAPEETALRETTEESGYADLAILGELGERQVEFDFEGKHIIRTEFYYLMQLCSDATEQRSKKDAAQFKVLWLPTEEAVAALTYQAEQEVAQRALALFETLKNGSSH